MILLSVDVQLDQSLAADEFAVSLLDDCLNILLGLNIKLLQLALQVL